MILTGLNISVDNFSGFAIAFFPFFINLVIAAYVFAKFHQSKMAVVFGFFTLSLAGWQLNDSLMRIISDAETADMLDNFFSLSWLSVGPLGMHFALLFTGWLDRDRKRNWILAIVYLPFLFFLITYLTRIYPHELNYHDFWGWVNSHNRHWLDILQVNMISAAVIIILLLIFSYAYTHRRNSSIAYPAFILAAGISIPVIQGVITQVIFPIMIHHDPIPLASTFMSFLSAATLIALTRYRIFNVVSNIDVNSLMDIMTNSVLVFSKTQELEYANKQGARSLQLETKSDKKIRLSQLFRKNSDYEQFRKEVFDKTLNGNSVVNYNTTISGQNGSPKHLMITSDRISYGTGFKGVMMVMKDVTDLKKTESALLESEELHRTILDSISEGIIITDTNDRIIFLNKGIEKLTGFYKEELVGELAYKILLPEDNWPDMIKRAGNRLEGISESYEMELIKKNGRKFLAEIHAVPYAKNDQEIIGTIAAINDISSKRAADNANARLAAIIESSDDAIIGKTLDGIVTSWNAGAERLFGYTAGEMIGNSTDILTPENLGDETSKVIEFVKRGIHINHFETQKLRKDKKLITVSLSISPIFDSKKNVIGISKIARDLTGIVQAKQALAQRAEELSRSNEDLEQFAYVASHDLQEPLRTITSYVQLLEKKYKNLLDKEATEFMDFIVDGATRMHVLINDLLTYSRIGTQVYFTGPIDTNLVVDNIRSDLRHIIDETKTEIRHSDLPLITGSITHLRILFQNLIGNAIKFRRSHNPVIEIKATETEYEWMFSVKDNGIGIPREYSKKIFTIFQRLHSRDKYPGTGIGLAICKKIVEQHKGRIWVESEQEKGSEFIFTIDKNLLKN